MAENYTPRPFFGKPIDTPPGHKWMGFTEKCAEWHRLDRVFNTGNNSPLHHDNRCTDCTR